MALEAAVSRAVDLVRHEVNVLRNQMKALQAIDVDLAFREGGKVIVICRVHGADIVKIIDVKPDWRMTEYQNLVRAIEAEFGTPARWVDAGMGGAGHDFRRYLKNG